MQERKDNVLRTLYKVNILHIYTILFLEHKVIRLIVTKIELNKSPIANFTHELCFEVFRLCFELSAITIYWLSVIS